MSEPQPADKSCSVVTDCDGRIIELNEAAADLLNIRPKGLARHPRTLAMFFATSRTAILSAQSVATPTPTDPIPALLRPREHAPRPVVVRVQKASDGYLEWTIHLSKGRAR